MVAAAVAGDPDVSHAALGGFRADAQMRAVQLTRALPGLSSWPNGQHCDLFSDRETGT
jgi:hypothetical protein